jgi:hypothetical protein
MPQLYDLLSRIPMASIARRLGVDEATARQAVEAAVPTLLGGMRANADHPAGAASLTNALADHGQLLDREVDMDRVDTAEGDKTVHNVFGDNTDQVAHTLGAAPETGAKVNENLIAKVMPMLAPIVLAYLAKQMGRKMGGGQAGGLGDVLGGLLGRGGQRGGLGGLLGGLLGGGKR